MTTDATRFTMFPEDGSPALHGEPDNVAPDEGYVLMIGARAVTLEVAEARTVRDTLTAWLATAEVVDVEIVDDHSAGCLCSTCCDERNALRASPTVPDLMADLMASIDETSL